MNILNRPPPLKGFVMNKWAVVCVWELGLRNILFVEVSSFSKAFARPKPECKSLAPDSSARNSLDLDMAIWMIAAKSGVKIAKIRSSNPLPPSLSLPPKPPNMAAHLAMNAI